MPLFRLMVQFALAVEVTGLSSAMLRADEPSHAGPAPTPTRSRARQGDLQAEGLARLLFLDGPKGRPSRCSGKLLEAGEKGAKPAWVQLDFSCLSEGDAIVTVEGFPEKLKVVCPIAPKRESKLPWLCELSKESRDQLPEDAGACYAGDSASVAHLKENKPTLCPPTPTPTPPPTPTAEKTQSPSPTETPTPPRSPSPARTSLAQAPSKNDTAPQVGVPQASPRPSQSPAPTPAQLVQAKPTPPPTTTPLSGSSLKAASSEASPIPTPLVPPALTAIPIATLLPDGIGPKALTPSPTPAGSGGAYAEPTAIPTRAVTLSLPLGTEPRPTRSPAPLSEPASEAPQTPLRRLTPTPTPAVGGVPVSLKPSPVPTALPPRREKEFSGSSIAQSITPPAKSLQPALSSVGKRPPVSAQRAPAGSYLGGGPTSSSPFLAPIFGFSDHD